MEYERCKDERAGVKWLGARFVCGWQRKLILFVQKLPGVFYRWVENFKTGCLSKISVEKWYVREVSAHYVRITLISYHMSWNTKRAHALSYKPGEGGGAQFNRGLYIFPCALRD